MNMTHSFTVATEGLAYAQLRREIHSALLAQHPEWIEGKGSCPKCDDYDRRFAELLTELLPRQRRGLPQGNARQFQFGFQYPIRVRRTHLVQ